ncbi:MAG: 5-oxoprolinase subunit PxpB [Clostridia bacterium]|nr:5-oxoprolinase subunit PxpB [Clostridia bacterium]
MRARAVGDAYVLLDAFSEDAQGEISEEVSRRIHALARHLKSLALPGILDMVPGYESLLLIVDPSRAGREEVIRTVFSAAKKISEAEEGSKRQSNGRELSAERVIEIPVCYGGAYGPDLAEVASLHGLREEEVVSLHAGRTYPVYMLGFLPGFPYLGGLDPRLHTPRLSQPRTRIPEGSVGIGGSQTGIYPLPSPGGWRIIGRTPMRLLGPEGDIPYRAGDRIRFVPISQDTMEEMLRAQGKEPEAAEPERDETQVCLRVLQGGFLTTVQDGGRYGHAGEGYTECGACDGELAAYCNMLCGNSPDMHAAVLEMTLTGPDLLFEEDALIAICGFGLTPFLHDLPVPLFQAVRAKKGDVLHVGSIREGNRAYLGIRGGIRTRPMLGSRATDLKCGIGGWKGRGLLAGDRVPVAGRGKMDAEIPMAQPWPVPCLEHHPRVRCTVGPQAEKFTPESVELFVSESFTVTRETGRMGIRLEGKELIAEGGYDILSDAVVAGSVQVSDRGKMIVMLCDHQTVGGYAKIATVISADLPLLSRLSPGDTVHFVPVTPGEAEEIRERTPWLSWR